MIFWTGWGILAWAMLLASFWLRGPLENTSLDWRLSNGIANVAVGLLIWLVGRWFNVLRPRASAERLMPAREAEVRQAVEEGRFAPGGIRPTSLEQARAQADQMLDEERRQLVAGGQRHTFLFLPMHWWGIAPAACGVHAVIHGLVG